MGTYEVRVRAAISSTPPLLSWRIHIQDRSNVPPISTTLTTLYKRL